MRRFFIWTLAAALALAGGWAAARIGLVTIPARQDIRIKIDRNNNALVQERRGITLKKGMNRIEFSWPNMQIDFNTAQLIPLEQQETISILSVAVPPNAPNTLILEVESQKPILAPFRITYLTSGISWKRPTSPSPTWTKRRYSWKRASPSPTTRWRITITPPLRCRSASRFVSSFRAARRRRSFFFRRPLYRSSRPICRIRAYIQTRRRCITCSRTTRRAA